MIFLKKMHLVLYLPYLKKTRDLKIKHIDIIDFMLKSIFCLLFINDSLIIHL